MKTCLGLSALNNGCQFRTKIKGRLNEHNNIHLNAYICEFCEKCFSCKGYLIRHKLIHTKTTKNIKLEYRCDWSGCKRVFIRNYQLKDHMNTHTAEKLFQCTWPNCDKAMINKQSLSTHMRRHKKSDYQCKIRWLRVSNNEFVSL